MSRIMIFDSAAVRVFQREVASGKPLSAWFRCELNEEPAVNISAFFWHHLLISPVVRCNGLTKSGHPLRLSLSPLLSHSKCSCDVKVEVCSFGHKESFPSEQECVELGCS